MAIGWLILTIDPDRGLVDGEPIAQTVTCFCDIPFDSLGIHTKKYGLFGVGVDRATVAEWGGRPVIYVPVVNGNLGGPPCSPQTRVPDTGSPALPRSARLGHGMWRVISLPISGNEKTAPFTGRFSVFFRTGYGTDNQKRPKPLI